MKLRAVIVSDAKASTLQMSQGTLEQTASPVVREVPLNQDHPDPSQDRRRNAKHARLGTLHIQLRDVGRISQDEVAERDCVDLLGRR